MTVVIDADGHVEEDLAWIVDHVDPSLRHLVPRFERDAGGHVVNLIEGRPWRPAFRLPRGSKTHVAAGGVERSGGRDPVERLRWMDGEGAYLNVVYPYPAWFSFASDPVLAAAGCRALNRWAAAFSDVNRDRLKPAMMLPVLFPDLALAEFRAVERD